MKKCVLLVFAVLLLSCMAFTSEAAIYPDAILYSIDNNGVLLFNVLHSADITNATIVDKTGSGITTIANLKDVMGIPDVPTPQFGTDLGQQRTLGKAVTATIEIGVNKKIYNLTITNIRERPLIGISKRTFSSTAPSNGNEIFWAGAFEKNGAFVVFLDTVTDADGAKGYLEKLNGIFMCGGEDWHPALYGETVTPHGSSGWSIGRDISDINLMRQAVSLDVPMLAACRGEQGFNVAMGGGLVQDVPYYLAEEIKAGNINESRVTGNSGGISTHRVYKYEDIIKTDGTLVPYSGTGAAPYTTVNCNTEGCRRVQVDGLIHSGGTSYHKLDAGEKSGILPAAKWLYDIIGVRFMPAVATAHHQSVNPKKLGDGITIVAYSTDGIVEAIEHQSSLFALGIQWHPERDAGGGTSGITNGYVDPDNSNAMLRALVKYSGIHKDRKALLSFFKNNELPQIFELIENGQDGLEYLELFKDKATVLDGSTLDGWSITGVSPQDAGSWLANVVSGSVVVTLNECVTDEAVIVKLTKGGETKEVAITFSGEKTVVPGDPDDPVDSSSSGCNAAQGYLVLAFFMGAVPYIFSKRK